MSEHNLPEGWGGIIHGNDTVADSKSILDQEQNMSPKMEGLRKTFSFDGNPDSDATWGVIRRFKRGTHTGFVEWELLGDPNKD